ncbi:MAG TPA: hypothetical protein VN950_25825 [Terriglobales bacterium]|nr:hypothetical protein [Terriglobales bacterium]
MSKHLYPRRPLKTLAVTVLLSAWCANAQPVSAQNTPPEDKQDSIRGIVVNSVTREPIGHALVYSPDNRFATMTDGEGRFEFSLAKAENDETKEDRPSPAIAAGSSANICGPNGCTHYTSANGAYRIGTLMARKPGFLTDQNATRNLQQDATKELTISLTPEALIVGRVVLPTSEPSDIIQLELYRRQVQEGRAHWVRENAATTKSNGEFRFAELPAGSYKLLTRELLDRDPLTFDPRGQLYGYPPVYFPNATNFEAAQNIQLTAGQNFQADISLVRRAYYPVKVAVANVPDNVHGFSIVVSPQGHPGPGYALGYNNQTQMIEGLLPDGNYTLEAESAGPAASGLVNISVKGAAAEGNRMTAVPNSSIGVNVKEEFTSSEQSASRSFRFEGNSTALNQRNPARYLNIRLEPDNYFGNNSVFVPRPPSGPDDDSLVIDGVWPGRYWVRVEAFRGFVASISSGTTDLQHQPLVVGLGGSSAPIEITLRDGSAEIDGTVEGLAALSASDGQTASAIRTGPVSDRSFAHLYFIPLPDSSGDFKDFWVQPDGKFGPQQLPPGTYRVLAFDRPQPDLEYRNPEAMKAYDAKGQLVRLIAGQKEHLHLQLISTTE